MEIENFLISLITTINYLYHDFLEFKIIKEQFGLLQKGWIYLDNNNEPVGFPILPAFKKIMLELYPTVIWFDATANEFILTKKTVYEYGVNWLTCEHLTKEKVLEMIKINEEKMLKTENELQTKYIDITKYLKKEYKINL